MEWKVLDADGNRSHALNDEPGTHTPDTGNPKTPLAGRVTICKEFWFNKFLRNFHIVFYRNLAHLYFVTISILIFDNSSIPLYGIMNLGQKFSHCPLHENCPEWLIQHVTGTVHRSLIQCICTSGEETKNLCSWWGPRDNHAGPGYIFREIILLTRNKGDTFRFVISWNLMFFYCSLETANSIASNWS